MDLRDGAVARPDPEESTEMLRERLRTVLLLCLLAIALFAVSDLIWSSRRGWRSSTVSARRPDSAPDRRAVCADPRERGALIAVGLTSIALMYALGTVSAVAAATGDQPMLSVAVAFRHRHVAALGVARSWRWC